MRLLLAGGRHLENIGMIRHGLDRAHALGPVEVLIHGGAGVLGTTAEDWARDHRIHVVRYPANWQAFGKRAEAIRDEFMLADGRPELVLALPGGVDTRALVHRAQKRGLPVVDHDGRPLMDGSDAPEPERWRNIPAIAASFF